MENNKYKCVYCEYWIVSPVKKNTGTSNKVIHRKCPTIKRLINADSESCKYFKPAEVIYCDLNSQRINIINCMVRRRNPRNFAKAYSNCKKCRQFDQDLSPILEDYYIGNKKILELEVKQEGRKIKRRAGHPKKETRKIKRRKIEQPKRKIIRRKKKRKIKRRGDKK